PRPRRTPLPAAAMSPTNRLKLSRSRSAACGSVGARGPPGQERRGRELRGSESTTWGNETRLHRQDLLLLRLEQFVDFLDLSVGELLRFFEAATLVVLGNRLVLIELLEPVVALVPVAADLDARLLRHVVRLLRQVLPAILGQRGNRDPHELPVGLRVQAQLGLP